MNYPNKWVTEIAEEFHSATHEVIAKHGGREAHARWCLDRWHEMGMIKDPPKPKEFWLVRDVHGKYEVFLKEQHPPFDCIHVMEVIDDE